MAGGVGDGRWTLGNKKHQRFQQRLPLVTPNRKTGVLDPSIPNTEALVRVAEHDPYGFHQRGDLDQQQEKKSPHSL